MLPLSTVNENCLEVQDTYFHVLGEERTKNRPVFISFPLLKLDFICFRSLYNVYAQN